MWLLLKLKIKIAFSQVSWYLTITYEINFLLAKIIYSFTENVHVIFI